MTSKNKNETDFINISPQQKDVFAKNNGVDFDELNQKMFKVVGERLDEAEHLSSKPYSYWKTVGKILIKSPTFMISLAILIGIIIAMFAFAPPGTILIPELENLPNNGGGVPVAPSWKYPFGLGVGGEDFFIYVWAGTRTTLLFALLITAIEVILGVLIGSIWGYFRKTDLLFINITNFLSLIPFLVFILFFLFLMKSTGGFWVIVFAITWIIWIGMAKITRIQVMLVKNTDYNTASVFLGSKSSKIIKRNIMPRILPVIAQQASLSIPAAISLDATLSFLGFGYVNDKDLTQTSLGFIVNKVLTSGLYEVYPHLIIFPILMITLISLVFYLMGKVFADSLDPKNHR